MGRRERSNQKQEGINGGFFRFLLKTPANGPGNGHISIRPAAYIVITACGQALAIDTFGYASTEQLHTVRTVTMWTIIYLWTSG